MDNDGIANNENPITIKTDTNEPIEETSQESGQNNEDISINNTNAEPASDVSDIQQGKQQDVSKDLEQKTIELENKEKELNARQLRMDAINILYDKNLPVDMLEFVLGDDLNSTKTKINKFQELFNNSVQKHVLEKLKGSPLKTGNISTGQNYTSIVRNAIRG